MNRSIQVDELTFVVHILITLNTTLCEIEAPPPPKVPPYSKVTVCEECVKLSLTPIPLKSDGLDFVKIWVRRPEKDKFYLSVVKLRTFMREELHWDVDRTLLETDNQLD